MRSLLNQIFDFRRDPFTGLLVPAEVRIRAGVPDEIVECNVIEEFGWHGLRLREEPQTPSGSESPADKFRLFRETAPNSGVWTVELLQVDFGVVPGPGQYKVAWGSGSGLVQMNFSNSTSTSGYRYAPVYDGLGTILAAQVMPGPARQDADGPKVVRLPGGGLMQFGVNLEYEFDEWYGFDEAFQGTPWFQPYTMTGSTPDGNDPTHTLQAIWTKTQWKITREVYHGPTAPHGIIESPDPPSGPMGYFAFGF